MHLNVWFQENKFLINIDIINFTIFGNKGQHFRRNPLPILIDEVNVLQSTSYISLELIINENVTCANIYRKFV